MQFRHPAEQFNRFAVPVLIAVAMFGVTFLSGAQMTSALTQTSGASAQLTSNDLGISSDHLSATVVVHTPAGIGIGPDAVEVYISEVRQAYPDADFAITGARSVNGLIVFDWQGTVDGTVVLPGRTLVTIDDGTIVRVTFLNLNTVSPVASGFGPDTRTLPATTSVDAWVGVHLEDAR